MSKVTVRILNIGLILAGISLGLWLINLNVPYYGSLIIKLDQTKNQPMLSTLGPEVRVVSQNGLVQILESPVYFDLRTMPWFNKMLIYVTFRSQGDDFEGIAPQVGPGWQYHLQKPLTILDLEYGWQKAVFEFNLNEVYKEKNVSRFLISTIHEPNGFLEVKNLAIILQQ